jgi:hypothetical protein
MPTHPLSGHEPDPLPADDLECDPGIGRSAGTAGEDPHIDDGENTDEGDVGNDAGVGGGVDPNQLGRTNR